MELIVDLNGSSKRVLDTYGYRESFTFAKLMQPRVEKIDACPLDKQPAQRIYTGLPDRLHYTPGSYNIDWCDSCQLAWLNPRPIAEDIALCYPEAYYTHTPPLALKAALAKPSRWQRFRKAILHSWYGYPAEGLPLSLKVVGKIAGLIPYLRRRAYYSLKLRFPWTGEGRLLDVGCGNGTYLLYMQALGWEAVGVDPDPSAVEACRQVGLTAYVGTLESQQFPEAHFDVVTMSHVIEHVPDPVALLQECYRILRPGGYIGIVTPNWESLGHMLFKANWFALEIPRHLFLYTPKSLIFLLKKAGFSSYKSKTLADKWMLQCIYSLSKQFEKYDRAEGEVFSLRIRAFELAERLLLVFFPYIGEEILVIAQKPIRL